MKFSIGDPVVHWTYGLGEIIGLEERALAGQKILYYVVKIQDLTVYVPADDGVKGRLRSPTPEREFKKLFTILSEPGESLPDNRFERKTQLHQRLEGGKIEAICRVIRDLSSYEQIKRLNDNDKNALKRAWNSLRGEWGFSLSMPLAQVEIELRRLLSHPPEPVAS